MHFQCAEIAFNVNRVYFFKVSSGTNRVLLSLKGALDVQLETKVLSPQVGRYSCPQRSEFMEIYSRYYHVKCFNLDSITNLIHG